MNKLAHFYREMLRVRRFEETVSELLSEGVLGGTTHLCIGQEACAVGVAAALKNGDQVISNHRGHGHLLAQGGRMAPLLAELAGRQAGYCRGKGGSQHVAVPEVGFMGSNGITGGGLPIAVGLGLAARREQDGRVVVAFLGDGATTTGNFHESLNLAALWQLPVIFVCENNLYAMSNPVSEAMAARSPVSWAARYEGLSTAEVDGQDVVAVAEVMESLVEAARQGRPAFLEARTYRLCGHSRSDPRSYRSREEEEAWRRRDPLVLLKAALLPEMGEGAIEVLHREVEEEVEEARDLVSSSPAALAAARSGVIETDSSPCGPAPSYFAGLKKPWSMREAIRTTLAQALEDDEHTLILGEDIGCYGGAFGLTRGLLERFGPDRILQTPISENSFVGASVGLAMAGWKPVVEIMFADFVTCCMDALVNHAAKIRYMYDGLLHVPMVLRAPMGRRHGYGATHSQSPEAFFMHVPGLKVVVPSGANSAAALLHLAIKDPDPVLFFEHKLLYDVEEEPEWDETLSLGQARRRRRGRDITLIASSRGVSLALQAARTLSTRGIEADVIDLLTLSPLDRETCLESVRRTQRVILIGEDTDQGGVAAIVESQLSADWFSHLRAPARRVCGYDAPTPSGRELEDQVMVHPAMIVEAACELVENY